MTGRVDAAAVNSDRAEVGATAQMVGQAQAAVQAAQATLDQAKLNLSYTHIVAPATGVVGDKTVQVGQRVQPGEQLLSVVPLNDIWITADFRETQLRKMRRGEPVTVHVDTTGRDYKGYIEGLPGATGELDSLLPPENATGNYVKVVQRLPVRIRLYPGEDPDHRLRPGMSVEPTVWVSWASSDSLVRRWQPRQKIIDPRGSSTPAKRRVNPWVIAAVVSLAAFMEVLDTSIANVALPYMAGGLASSLDDASWVLTSYLVANAIVLPISGWLSIRFGRKRFYMTCVVIFTISSFLCGIAPSLGMLILFRVIQGAGGGGLQPVSQAILRDTFPPERLGAAFAVYGMVVVLAPAIGPTIGGWITDNYQWRWIFYMNVPVGILSLLLVSRLIEDPAYLTRQLEKAARTYEHRLHRYRLARSDPWRFAGRARQGPGRQLVLFANDCDPRGDLSGCAGTVYRLGIDPLEAGDGSADVQEPQLRGSGGDDFCLRRSGLRNDRFHAAIRPGVHGL